MTCFNMRYVMTHVSMLALSMLHMWQCYKQNRFTDWVICHMAPVQDYMWVTCHLSMLHMCLCYLYTVVLYIQSCTRKNKWYSKEWRSWCYLCINTHIYCIYLLNRFAHWITCNMAPVKERMWVAFQLFQIMHLMTLYM